jgi:hypothetical protein
MIHFNVDFYVLRFPLGEHGEASGVGRETREKNEKNQSFYKRRVCRVPVWKDLSGYQPGN